VNPVFVEALNDRLFGEFTDKPYGSISAYCLAHRLDKETFVPRNGESVAQVKQRVRLFLDSLDDGTYLIIAHAAVIRIIVQLMTGLHWEKVQVQNVALWAIEDNKILHDNWRPWEAKNK
jgi:broad specificity phosphatase PhoE